MSDDVVFDSHTLKMMKRAYNDALAAHKDSFWFGGREYVTQYAKYLIEYLEPKFRSYKRLHGD